MPRSKNSKGQAARRGACCPCSKQPAYEGWPAARAAAAILAVPPKGQAATEFLTFSSFFLLLFLVLTAVFYNQQSVEISQKQSLLARELASQYADSANFALRTGNSFRGTFNFPTGILGRPYTITFSNGSSGFAYVSWESPGGAESTYSARLSTGAIQLEPGCNDCSIEEVVPGERYLLVFIPNGKMTFINRDGVLYINQ